MASPLHCPDGGACHHECVARCWRVGTCAPLSETGWEDWPREVKALHATKIGEGVARLLLGLERQKVSALAGSLEGQHEVVRALAEQYGQMITYLEGISGLLEALDSEVTEGLRGTCVEIIAVGRDWLLDIKRLDSSLPELLRAAREGATTDADR